ncbi:MAG TPA: hypothetical protein VKZ51_09725, partial [Cyclobacteriaceae bacterium]|nr:hypothetical protein [Cyclobacteriaceae bacterium]
MKTLPFVWGFIAFSILGLDIFNQTETFVALQDFESNIKPAVHPEEFLPNWSANVVRDNSSRVFQEPGEGINGSKALGIQPIGSFNAQIYIKTTSKNLATPRISLQAKTRRNGSGNRPVYVFYSFSADEGTTFSVKQQIGSEDTFSNVDGQYREYDFFIPDSLMERDPLIIKLDVEYGKGSGSAARLFIDDFKVHGLEKDPGLEIISVEASEGNTLTVDFNGDISLA